MPAGARWLSLAPAMPTYDYRCEACGHEFEREQRMSEDPIKKCPKCKKAKAKRQITGGNFILKGSGWYADLYHKPAEKKSEAKAETKADTSSSDASPSTGTSSNETKTDSAPKAESKPAKKAKKD